MPKLTLNDIEREQTEAKRRKDLSFLLEGKNIILEGQQERAVVIAAAEASLVRLKEQEALATKSDEVLLAKIEAVANQDEITEADFGALVELVLGSLAKELSFTYNA